MNWKKVGGILISLAVIALLVYTLKSNKEITDDKVYQYEKDQAIYITADTILQESINFGNKFTGTFEPYKESKISAESQGKINIFFVDVGSNVKKGQTLVQLDNSLLKLQLQQLEVQIKGLEKDVERYTILTQAEAIQGVQLEKADLGLKSAKIQKATLQEQINKTTIKSPFDGIVTAKFNEEGGFAAPGMPLLQLTDISRLKFTINVSENDIKLFEQNKSSSISIDAFPGDSIAGKIILIGSQANRGSSYPVQYMVNNTSDQKIKSGMFGKVHLDLAHGSEGIAIPVSSIFGEDNQKIVYLVKQDKIAIQNITIADRIDNKALISSGLKSGDILVTSGFVNLFEGANVIIQ